jgi:hypothetical protein
MRLIDQVKFGELYGTLGGSTSSLPRLRKRFVVPSLRRFVHTVGDPILREIEATIRSWDRSLNECYVGISAYPWTRLSDGHSVVVGLDRAGVWECRSSAVARYVERTLLSMGTIGGAGGGDENATSVYVYLKRAHTRE